MGNFFFNMFSQKPCSYWFNKIKLIILLITYYLRLLYAIHIEKANVSNIYYYKVHCKLFLNEISETMPSILEKLAFHIYLTYGIFMHDICFGISQFIAVIYSLNQFYLNIILTKLVTDQIIAINPHAWPFFAIRLIATPYLKFWENLMPQIFYIPKIMISDSIAVYVLGSIIPKILIKYSNYFYDLYLKGLMSGRF